MRANVNLHVQDGDIPIGTLPDKDGCPVASIRLGDLAGGTILFLPRDRRRAINYLSLLAAECERLGTELLAAEHAEVLAT